MKAKPGDRNGGKPLQRCTEITRSGVKLITEPLHTHNTHKRALILPRSFSFASIELHLRRLKGRTSFRASQSTAVTSEDMSFSLGAVFVLATVVRSYPNLYRDCRYNFNPQNYMESLPSLSLPFRGDVVPPNVALIRPTKVATKVINVVTKYVTRSPVCIKISGKKPPCAARRASNKNNSGYLITKEYYVKGKGTSRQNPPGSNEAHRQTRSVENDSGAVDASAINDVLVEPSESPDIDATDIATPVLSRANLRETWIEDRLDHLEQVLPGYTRRRVFETSTITVTKTRSNNRDMATLLVKNCVPYGVEICPGKVKKRAGTKQKVIDEQLLADNELGARSR